MRSIKWIGAIGAAVIAIAAITVYLQNASLPEEMPKIATSQLEEAADGAISSPYAKEFKLPDGTWPNGILVDSAGVVWAVGSKSHNLVSFDPESRESRFYPVQTPEGESAGSLMVWAIVEGKDGSILFSGSGKNALWRFDPQTGRFESTASLAGAPMQMKVGDDGKIWYTTFSKGVIGAAQKQGTDYAVRELELGGESFPSGVFLQNQTLWVTLSADGKISPFDVSSGRIVKKAEFPQNGMLSSPSDIILSSGSAWITEHGTSFLTEYDLETSQVKRYPTALHPILVSTLPYWLEEDLGGKGVWFNEHRGNRIAFFDFSTHTLTEYEVPTRNPEAGNIANVLTIAADPTNEDKVWFTEFTEDKIGYVDKSVPIPFDIRALDRKIVVGEGETAQINLEVTRKPGVQLFNNTLSFGTSSSLVTSGVLLNATSSFSSDPIDLSKVNSTQTVTLELRNDGMPKGNHILAVSATDGAVIRTVYIDLGVK